MRSTYKFEGFDVTLKQHGKDNFTVLYGSQIEPCLTYAEATTKLGQALMHALACEGKIDNRTKGERD